MPAFGVIAFLAVASACTAGGQTPAERVSARILLLYGVAETRTQAPPFASPASLALLENARLENARLEDALLEDALLEDELQENALRDERWISYDKLQHVTFGFLFTVGAQYTLTDKMRVSTARATPISAVAGLSVGLAKEVYDWQISPSRRFDGRDLVADLAGVALGTVLILL